jgi:serine/threonine protein kinase
VDKKKKKKKKKDDLSDDSDAHDDTIGSYQGKPGEYIDKRYKILREAGLGTFGRVLLCADRDANDQVVALKVVRKVEKYSDSAKIEADILKDINSRDKDNESLCVVMHRWYIYRYICILDA